MSEALGPCILVVFASQGTATLRMVQALAEGAGGEGADVRLMRGTEAGLSDLLWCHGLVVATPENFGYMAGAVKDFFDRTYYPAQGQVDNLPYALLVKAGNDGTFAASSVQRIARGYPLRPIAEPLLVVGDIKEADLERCRELGQTMALGLAMGLFGRFGG